MVSMAERIAYLEGQSGEQVAAVDDLRAQVGSVRGELGELRGEVRELRGDMGRRFERLEDRFDTRFMWLVGLQVTTLLGVIALAASRLQ